MASGTNPIANNNHQSCMDHAKACLQSMPEDKQFMILMIGSIVIGLMASGIVSLAGASTLTATATFAYSLVGAGLVGMIILGVRVHLNEDKKKRPLEEEMKQEMVSTKEYIPVSRNYQVPTQ